LQKATKEHILLLAIVLLIHQKNSEDGSVEDSTVEDSSAEDGFEDCSGGDSKDESDNENNDESNDLICSHKNDNLAGKDGSEAGFLENDIVDTDDDLKSQPNGTYRKILCKRCVYQFNGNNGTCTNLSS